MRNLDFEEFISDTRIEIRSKDADEINEIVKMASSEGVILLRQGDSFSYQEMQQTLGRLSPVKKVISGGGGSIEFGIDPKSNLSWYVISIIALLSVFGLQRKKLYKEHTFGKVTTKWENGQFSNASLK